MRLTTRYLSITNFAATTALNAKINEVKNKIPNITNLATTALTVVENKIANVSDLVKKLTITQILVKFELKLLLIMIMINILLLKNLTSLHQKNLLKSKMSKFSKQN